MRKSEKFLLWFGRLDFADLSVWAVIFGAVVIGLFAVLAGKGVG